MPTVNLQSVAYIGVAALLAIFILAFATVPKTRSKLTELKPDSLDAIVLPRFTSAHGARDSSLVAGHVSFCSSRCLIRCEDPAMLGLMH